LQKRVEEETDSRIIKDIREAVEKIQKTQQSNH
jgi:hypothetical protein